MDIKYNTQVHSQALCWKAHKLKSSISSIPPDAKDDGRLNYGLQVIQLGVFLMQLNDTEAEGDGSQA